jgi:two-component system, chemotaxis family, sensor histidine kinase and response regulator WspE
LNQDNDLSNFSMLDLFRTEVETQVAILNEGLLALEKDPSAIQVIEKLMRAAHSLKGAARIVQIEPGVKVAHALEDCFVAAQKGKIVIRPEHMDVILEGIDFLMRTGSIKEEELAKWLNEQSAHTEQLVNKINGLTSGTQQQVKPAEPTSAEIAKTKEVDARTVRVHAENLNRLLAYAAETSVAANTLQNFVDSLRLLRTQQKELLSAVALLQESSKQTAIKEVIEEIANRAEQIQHQIGAKYSELETFSRRAMNITKRLYREVLDSRMRPFREGVEGFPRMVRDVSRKLGKKVHFEITGKSTKVDRDILEKLEAPLNHLLRNALDHGIEAPEERIAAGKPEEATLLLEVRHAAGMLHIRIVDDGRGINYSRLREKLLEKKLITPEMAEKLSEQEMLEFLFLPGFSTTDEVTEFSGRGFGLDIVYNMVREVGGNVQAFSKTGEGTTIHLQLPLTLSLLRALMVEIAQEIYAFPLARIDKTLFIHDDEMMLKDGRMFFQLDGVEVPLVSAGQILQLEQMPTNGVRSVILVSETVNKYGIIVDRFLMQKDLVVRPLDQRLGKVKDVHAASILEDGSAVLILDLQDMIRSINQLLNHGESQAVTTAERKRILIVEDSLTVRELERKLLENHGYRVDAAVDGMDGWNALRHATYDLVITDFDMPRLNGLELIQRIRSDPKLNRLPVIIVSYKEREADRSAGIEAGANQYLSKGSFHDRTFINAVMELIGEA